MSDLTQKRAEYQSALQRAIEIEADLLNRLTQVRAEGQLIKGAIAALTEQLDGTPVLAPTPAVIQNRAARRRK